MKHYIKRTVFAAVIAAMLIAAMSGCSGSTSGGAGRKKILCTTFPAYDWMKNIIGDNNDSYELILLVDNGTDMHSFQPSAADIVKIATSDIVVYVGGTSDEWVEQAAANGDNKSQKLISLMDILGDDVKEEELVEGMQEEDEHGHEHADGHNEEEYSGSEHTDNAAQDEPEYDEHVWLSVKNAKRFCNEFLAVLSQMDSEHSAEYESNAKAYIEELDKLDELYTQLFAGNDTKPLLFADRFPFRYLTDDYNVSYYAAFPGCSAETEASFETVAFLAERIDEYNINVVFIIDNSDGRVAKTVTESTKNKNQQIISLNSMQAVTAADIKNGASYTGIMTDNYGKISQAVR